MEGTRWTGWMEGLDFLKIEFISVAGSIYMLSSIWNQLYLGRGWAFEGTSRQLYTGHTPLNMQA